MQWHEYFIQMAMLVSSKSKDPSTKVGCVIVGPDNEIRSTGFNGFPRGVVEEVETPAHLVTEVQYDITRQGLSARCSCGEVVNDIPPPTEEFMAGRHAGMYDMQMAVAGLHEHFGVPEGEMILHPERWERPLKYDFVEHAERNAVYNAARVGIPTNGCTAYLNWEPYPCKECAKAFAQAGIVEVIGPDIEFPNHKKAEAEASGLQWDSGDQWNFTVSRQIMDEAGVKYTRIPWNAERGDNL